MVDVNSVHEVLKRFQLADGFEIVLDLDRSHGSWLVDARDGKEYLDAFTCFASWPVGYDHPRLRDPEFSEELLRVARIKPANSDLYTPEMASFVETFCTKLTPAGYPHHFWVSGGSLAVENALKTAFDWKARKLGRTRFDDDVEDLVILHFRQAFHGRSGYTLSLTNTVPDKIGLFPKFPWPRVHNPYIVFDLDGGIANDIEAEEARSRQEIEAVFSKHKGKVAAIVLEPIQGEGGDNHFRPEFLSRLRHYADEEEALLIFDEVQTGFYGTGSAWAWQQLGSAPDVVCFGKKTQVCGIYASDRIDEVPENVFRTSSRINSTWGGNLVDMVRCRRLIEIVLEENLGDHVTRMGARLIEGLREVARSGGEISSVRGCGSLVAFTLESAEVRGRVLRRLFENRLLALPTGTSSIRFRLPLNVKPDEVDEIAARTAAALPSQVRA